MPRKWVGRTVFQRDVEEPAAPPEGEQQQPVPSGADVLPVPPAEHARPDHVRSNRSRDASLTLDYDEPSDQEPALPGVPTLQNAANTSQVAGQPRAR